MESENISFYGFSTRGQREMQQDYYFAEQDDTCIICIICDGMGGMDAGNEISKLVGDMLALDIRLYSSESNMHAFFEQELKKLDDYIFQLKDSEGNRIHGGTTVAACVIYEQRLYWFSVGDSRIYCNRDGRCYQLTQDHNYGMHLQNMKQQGEITTVQYYAQQDKAEQLTSYIGMGAADVFDSNYKALVLKQGDRLFLCSDGIYRTLPKNELQTLLNENIALPLLGSKILDEIAMKKIRNQDNATGILIHVN